MAVLAKIIVNWENATICVTACAQDSDEIIVDEMSSKVLHW